MRVRSKMAGLLLAASMISSVAAAQQVSRSEFANPPATYRPTVTTEEGAGYAAPLEVAARRAIDELDAGAIMIAPQDGPGPDKPLDMAGLAAVWPGLL